MTDPFVPTGRELDEGVTGPGLDREENARPGLLRRLFGRGAKHAGKNLTETELNLSTAVAIKRPGVRARSATERTSAAESTFVIPLVPPSNSAAKPERRGRGQGNTADALLDAFVPTEDFIASIVTLTRSPSAEASGICLNYLSAGACSDEHRELVTWWLSCLETPIPPLPAELQAIVPNEVIASVDAIRAHDTHLSLVEYQRLCGAWDRYDVAAKELTRKARSFPSLEPLVASIKKGDLDSAKAHIDYGSAAWHECSQTISETIAALEATHRFATRPELVKLPRTTSDLPLIQRAVVSTLCVPSSLVALSSTCMEVLKVTSIPDSQPEIQALVAHLLEIRSFPK